MPEFWVCDDPDDSGEDFTLVSEVSVEVPNPNEELVRPLELDAVSRRKNVLVRDERATAVCVEITAVPVFDAGMNGIRNIRKCSKIHLDDK